MEDYRDLIIPALFVGLSVAYVNGGRQDPESVYPLADIAAAESPRDTGRFPAIKREIDAYLAVSKKMSSDVSQELFKIRSGKASVKDLGNAVLQAERFLDTKRPYNKDSLRQQYHDIGKMRTYNESERQQQKQILEDILSVVKNFEALEKKVKAAKDEYQLKRLKQNVLDPLYDDQIQDPIAQVPLSFNQISQERVPLTTTFPVTPEKQRARTYTEESTISNLSPNLTRIKSYDTPPRQSIKVGSVRKVTPAPRRRPQVPSSAPADIPSRDPMLQYVTEKNLEKYKKAVQDLWKDIQSTDPENLEQYAEVMLNLSPEPLPQGGFASIRFGAEYVQLSGEQIPKEHFLRSSTWLGYNKVLTYLKPQWTPVLNGYWWDSKTNKYVRKDHNMKYTKGAVATGDRAADPPSPRVKRPASEVIKGTNIQVVNKKEPSAFNQIKKEELPPPDMPENPTETPQGLAKKYDQETAELAKKYTDTGNK